MKKHIYSALAFLLFAILAGSSVDEGDFTFFKWVIILSVILGISLPIIQYFSTQQKAKSLKNIPKFVCDEIITLGDLGVAIDVKQKKIALTNEPAPLVINYTDLINVELIENGTTVLKKTTSRTVGGAVIGGVLLGPLGAIFGGVSGKSHLHGKTNSIALKITINNMQKPIHYLYFLNVETKRNSLVYSNAKTLAEKWHGKFATIINSVDNSMANTDVQSNSIADELLKLNTLREKGIITEDEFNKQKQKLLNQ